MSRSGRERVAGLVRFFSGPGRARDGGPLDRAEVLRGLDDARILAVLGAVSAAGVRERDLVHELVAYANTHPRAAREVTSEDLRQLRDLLKVREVMDL